MPLSPYEPPHSETNLSETAHRRLKAPAIGIIVTGLLTALIPLLIIVFFLVSSETFTSVWQDEFQEDPTFIVYAIYYAVHIPGGLFVCYCGTKILRGEKWGLAMTGAIVAMIFNFGVCCWLGVPCGIWALVILTNKEVKATFRKTR